MTKQPAYETLQEDVNCLDWELDYINKVLDRLNIPSEEGMTTSERMDILEERHKSKELND